jgi:hypothetical protein
MRVAAHDDVCVDAGERSAQRSSGLMRVKISSSFAASRGRRGRGRP